MTWTPRRLIGRAAVAVVVALALDLAGAVVARDAAAVVPGTGPTPPEPPRQSIDREPYRIRVLLAIDPEARIDAARRAVLLADWSTLVRRFVGAPWVVEVASEGPAESSSAALESLQPDDLKDAARGVDKVWVIGISAEGSGLGFRGRELDVTTGRVGPLQRRSARVVADAARVLFQFALDLFSPYAEVGERFGKDVFVTVRAASIAPASPIGRVVVEGLIFQPLRVVPRKDGAPLVREISFTFLRVEAAEGAGARCSVVSVFGDPFTKRVVQKTSLAAIGVKPGKTPTRLRFLTLPDRAPAAGYVLTARAYPDGTPHEVGTTDREGRIRLIPTPSDGLLVLRLLAGRSEPMIEFPIMPGGSVEERTIPPFDPKPLTVTLETQLDSLRDSVIDLVAVRARLEARLKARFDGEDWAGAEEALKEFRQLPAREPFANALTRLKEEATRQQARTKKAILTQTAQAHLADLQALIDRYLDDEIFKGYADALEKMKTEPAAKPKAKPRDATPPKARGPAPAGKTP